MTGLLKGAVAATLLAGSTVAAVAPAQADRGDGAVIAGIAGLAIGAAIASNNNRGYYRNGYSGYYGGPSYYGGYDYGPSYSYGYGNDYYGRGGDWGRGGWSDRGGRYRDRGDWGRGWRR